MIDDWKPKIYYIGTDNRKIKTGSWNAKPAILVEDLLELIQEYDTSLILSKDDSKKDINNYKKSTLPRVKEFLRLKGVC